VFVGAGVRSRVLAAIAPLSEGGRRMETLGVVAFCLLVPALYAIGWIKGKGLA
jgi:hypothetical protein